MGGKSNELRQIDALEKIGTQLERLVKRLGDVEVTVRARANEEGVLYGSVGRKEIAAALAEEGHQVAPDQVVISEPIRHLDNVAVEVRFADDLTSTIKVWVVREKTGMEGDEPEETEAGKEAGDDDDRPVE